MTSLDTFRLYKQYITTEHRKDTTREPGLDNSRRHKIFPKPKKPTRSKLDRTLPPRHMVHNPRHFCRQILTLD